MAGTLLTLGGWLIFLFVNGETHGYRKERMLQIIAANCCELLKISFVKTMLLIVLFSARLFQTLVFVPRSVVGCLALCKVSLNV